MFSRDNGGENVPAGIVKSYPLTASAGEDVLGGIVKNFSNWTVSVDAAREDVLGGIVKMF